MNMYDMMVVQMPRFIFGCVSVRARELVTQVSLAIDASSVEMLGILACFWEPF